mgnify:CR=1 FL=1
MILFLMKWLHHQRWILTPAALIVLLAGCNAPAPPSPYQLPSGTEINPPRDIVFLSATELAKKIRTRELSSAEVVEAFINQIHRHNPELNAIVTIDEKAARQRALAADKALAGGDLWGPLHGVPVTVKDHFATAGMRTTNGYLPLANQTTDYDATIVSRLKTAGAIILGKTNMPVLGMDYQTTNPIFGTTRNPWDPGRTPGGSTGGGAAAVASGMTPLEVGSDLGGSIRIPSHYCGVFGLKATEHFISEHGSFPGVMDNGPQTVRHMVSQGPLARSIEDLELALAIMGNADPRDVNVPVVNHIPASTRKLNDLKIAWSDNFGDVPISDDTRETIRSFVRRLAENGCTVRQLNPPDFDFNTAWKTWGDIKSLEIDIHLPGYARFLVYTLGSLERRRNPLASMAYPASHWKYLDALTRRDQLVSAVEQFLTEWDVFICPVTATPAISHRTPERIIFGFPVYNDPVTVGTHDLNYWVAAGSYTTPFNLTGNPVVVIPAGLSTDGLPIGLQIVGPRWRDAELLQISKLLNNAAGRYQRPGGY